MPSVLQDPISKISTLIKGFLPVARGQEDRPPLVEQTPFKFGYFAIPGENPNSCEFFNCGLVDWRGSRFLVARRRKFTRFSRGVNDVVLCLLSGKQVGNPNPIKIFVKYPGENHEDPRALNWKGNLLISYCNFRLNSYAHQAYGTVMPDFRIARPISLVYGHNREDLMLGKWHEKNWVPFVTDGNLAFVYAMHPHHEILMIENERIVKTHASSGDWSLHWGWGEPRGGTPPILVGDYFYSFFHSSLPHRTLPDGQKRRRYYMGAYKFKATPPYAIEGMSTKPILSGSMHDRRNPGAPACVFPCGALLQNGVWFVTLGVGDTACAWIEIPHDDLVRMV